MHSLLISLGLLATTAPAADSNLVAYPEGYRDWHHLKSMVIEPGHPLHEPFGGIHHLYANTKAKEGYAKGRFADGAVIVFDLLETESAEHAVNEGARKIVGVMLKDSARFPATGGWGFEGFVAGDATRRAIGNDAKAAANCFACHQSQQAHDYVFSRPRTEEVKQP